MGFEIAEHAGPILEFVYPEHPTLAEVAGYVKDVRRLVDRQHAPWCCLVDQRKLPVMPQEFVETVKALNAYAAERGMRKTARLVNSAIASLQATRFAREVKLTEALRTFTSRAAALAWLAEP
jgi:hypothetical protein